jgi:hypothetical protein
MDRVRWILVRIAAAVAGAVAVGVVAAIILAVVEILTCGPTCTSIAGSGNTSRCVAYGSTCGDAAMQLLFNLIWTPGFALVLGIIPSIVALTITPARKYPWRSLPALVFGTLIGFSICVFLASHWDGGSSLGGLVTLIVVPTATGLAMAWNIDRLPPFFRLQARRA